MNIQTVEEFKSYVTQHEANFPKPYAFGIVKVQLGQKTQKPLTASFGVVNYEENYGSATVFLSLLKQHCIDNKCSYDFEAKLKGEFIKEVDTDFAKKALEIFAPFAQEAMGEQHKNIQAVKAIANAVDGGSYKLVFLFDDVQCQSLESAYLKLMLLNEGKKAPNTQNLNGIFGLLPNVAWSGLKAYELEWLRENEVILKLNDKYPCLDYVDKFPRFLMHTIPADNTRILESSKVRFGAYVSAGTTIIPGASYINFNAGTLGTSMIEGRISSSATVREGTDVGGGASILGVLSGTDGNAIGAGKNCLLGVNSVTGISLGDGCIVDAGIAVLAGTKFAISNAEKEKIAEINVSFDVSKEVYKGSELAGLNGLHFRQNSQTGAMIVMRSTREVKLNADLH